MGLALPAQTIVHLENRRSRFLSVEQLYLGDCRSAELPENRPRWGLKHPP